MNSSVIGVDLGGSKLAVAPLSGQALGDSLIESTDLRDPAALIEQLVTMVDSVRGAELDAVGIGVPSVVDFESGRVVSSVNVPLADVPLRQVLGDRLGVPVFVDNDATVAALAEAHDERLEPLTENLVMLTIGTGVGAGIVLGGRIYRGSTGGAGELGHTLVGIDAVAGVPPPQRFPQPGSLESLAAGQALDRLAGELADKQPQSTLGRLRTQGKLVTGVDAVQAAFAGDESAGQIVKLWAERIGIGIANAINTFDPDEVVIGGGVVHAGELLLTPARRVAEQYVLPGLGRRTRLRLASHGVRAGVLGAALLAAQEVESAAMPQRSDARGPSSAEGSRR